MYDQSSRHSVYDPFIASHARDCQACTTDPVGTVVYDIFIARHARGRHARTTDPVWPEAPAPHHHVRRVPEASAGPQQLTVDTANS